MRTQIKRFLKQLRRENKSINTIQSYQRTFNMFLSYISEGNQELTYQMLTLQAVEGYLDFLIEGGYADRTIAQHMAALRSFAKYLEYLKFQDKTLADYENTLKFMRSVKIKKQEPVLLSDEQYEKLQKHLQFQEDIKNKTLFETLRITGMRTSECINLKISDIRLSDQGLEIKVLGKGNKERSLRFSTKYDATHKFIGLIQDYMQWRLKQDAASDHLFINRGGKQIDRTSVWKKFQRICTKLGIEGVTTHSLRHMAATRLLHTPGVSATDVMHILGHANTNVTNTIYGHSNPEYIAKALNSII